jgi:hypothetical protein
LIEADLHLLPVSKLRTELCTTVLKRGALVYREGKGRWHSMREQIPFIAKAKPYKFDAQLS